MIGQLTHEPSARLLGEFLYAEGIKNQIEPEPDGTFVVWIYSEDQVESARQLLSQFLQNPENPRFRHVARGAADLRAREAEEQHAYEKRVHTPAQIWRERMLPLTLALIAISVAVTLISEWGRSEKVVRLLFISLSRSGLPEVRAGEIWRLITPIFLHFSIIHLLFNMLWLKDLGSMVERRQGTLRLAVLVLTMAVASNIGQYLVSEHYTFGGMSGVVYGLLGYVFIKGKFDPASGFFLHQTTMVMMMIWFFLCLAGVIPNVANTAHAVGLGVGALWGYLSARR